MAFIVAAGVRFAYKGVQAGIQAHQDFKSDEPPVAPLDRWGQPKSRNAVYGLVMKAEEKFNGNAKGKGREVITNNGNGNGEGSSASSSNGHGRERELNKEELEARQGGSQTYSSRKDSSEIAAPPTYEAAIAEPAHAQIQSGFGGGTPFPAAAPIPAVPHARSGGDNTKVKSGKPRRKASSSSTSSSDTSDSEDSDSDEDTSGPSRPATTSGRSASYTSRRTYKLHRRVARAQKRLERASAKAERNQARGRDRDSDVRKVRKAEWKLEDAQRQLERQGGQV